VTNLLLEDEILKKGGMFTQASKSGCRNYGNIDAARSREESLLRPYTPNRTYKVLVGVKLAQF
jgi:hypothetical protein